MNLEGVLAIGGKPGLYKLVAQSRGGVIVESLTEKKRFPVGQTGNVSALKDIAIYTHDEEVPLEEVFDKIAQKEDYEKTIDHKASPDELKAYMSEVLPEYDEDRVYTSDLKKLFQWYNLLHEQGMITKSEEAEEGGDEETQEAEKSAAEEKTPPKED